MIRVICRESGSSPLTPGAINGASFTPSAADEKTLVPVLAFMTGETDNTTLEEFNAWPRFAVAFTSGSFLLVKEDDDGNPVATLLIEPGMFFMTRRELAARDEDLRELFEAADKICRAYLGIVCAAMKNTPALRYQTVADLDENGRDVEQTAMLRRLGFEAMSGHGTVGLARQLTA